jgi:hypothetical protein
VNEQVRIMPRAKSPPYLIEASLIYYLDLANRVVTYLSIEAVPNTLASQIMGFRLNNRDLTILQ